MSQESQFLEQLGSLIESSFDVVQIDEDGDLMMIRDDASCGLWARLGTLPTIELEEHGKTAGRFIRLFSQVVRNIDLRQTESPARAYGTINKLNQDASVGRWILDVTSSNDDSPIGSVFFLEEVVFTDDQYFGKDSAQVFEYLVTAIYATMDSLDDEILEVFGSGELFSGPQPKPTEFVDSGWRIGTGD